MLLSNRPPPVCMAFVFDLRRRKKTESSSLHELYVVLSTSVSSIKPGESAKGTFWAHGTPVAVKPHGSSLQGAPSAEIWTYFDAN
ncbi:hypothetical protein VTI28DRAFT_6443 [Corynascus sepedonium]